MRSPLVAVVLSLMASIAAAEEEYFLKIEVVGYDQQKQPPEKDSVFSSIELLVQPGQPFHIESTKADWSTLAKGRLSKNAEGTFVLEIACARSSSLRGRMEAQTTATLTTGEPHVLGGIYSKPAGDKGLFSKEAISVTLQARNGNKTADARPARVRSKRVMIVPASYPDPMHIEKGMIFDAIEHEMRIKKSIRDKGNLPTTIDHGSMDVPRPLSDFLRDPSGK
jgi:hypothetical protein